MLRAPPHAGESQYELLNVTRETPAQERSDHSDNSASVSRSTSQERDLPTAKDYHRTDTFEQTTPATDATHATTRRLYVPRLLRRRSLVLLAISFLLLAGILALLFALSKRSTGISNVDNQLYYVWTYGPTAVFTIVAISWYNIEFRTMQLWSWHLMYQNSLPASEVVLDYTAMWNVRAMVLATRKGHFRIVTVVLGTLLISLLTIVSTGLFTNQSMVLGDDALLRFATSLQPPGNLNLTPIDELPYLQAFLVTHLNTTPPLGTNGAMVYEQFFDNSSTPNITASFATNTSYIARVKTLTMRMECEDATVIKDPRANASDNPYALAIKSASCSDTSFANSPSGYILQGGDYGLWASLGCCSCGPDDGLLESRYALQFDNGQDWRLFVNANHFKTQQTSRNITTTENSDFISYVCTAKVDSRMGDVTLARDSRTDQVLSNIVLGENVSVGLNTSSGTQLLLGAWKSYADFIGGPKAYNFLLNPGDDGDISKFFDSDLLKERIEDSMPKLMAQVASPYFMTGANSTVDGHISTISDRLVVRDTSFYLMLAALLILCTICAFMAFAGPLVSCSRDPSSIAAVAAILSQSPQLRKVLEVTGPYSIDSLKEYLMPVSVESRIDPSKDFRIAFNLRSDLLPNNTELKWWRPLSSIIPFRVLIILAPLGLLAVLETGVQLSTKYGHLVTVSTEGATHYLWLYLPPLLILGVRVLFEMVDFNSKIFQPLHLLAKGRASANTSLLESLQSKVAVVVLFRSIKNAYWSVAASSFAMLFGPFLSILVASLFIGVPANTSHKLTIRQVDRWNFSDPTGSLYYSPNWYPGIDSRDSSLGITLYLGQDGAIPSMILNYNLSFPKWTTSEIVLPTFEVFNVTEKSANDSIQARLPAIRPVLNCEEAAGRVSWYSKAAPNSDAGEIQVNLTYGVTGLGTQNDNCGYSNNFSIGLTSILTFSNGVPANYYYGDSVDTRLSSLNLTNRADCPTRLFLLAHLQTSTVKVMACRPRIDQVEADVTLNFPELSFSAQHPPSIVPGDPVIIHDGFFNSSHKVPETDSSEDNYPSGSDPFRSSGLGDIFPSVQEVNNALLGGYNYNTFLEIALSFGPSLEDMFNDIQLMNSQLEKLYGIIVGQLLRSSGIEKRAPAGNDPGQGDIQATLITSSERVNLIDNAVVSRVLEGLLALMTLCIIASMALQHTRKVVPKDPEGIIAVMSLVAGASQRFWDLFEKVEGVEWMSDDEMASNGMFKGVRFGMGWSGGAGKDVKGQYSQVAGTDPDENDQERRWCIDVDQRTNSGLT